MHFLHSLPGIKRSMCRWKDSSDVDPLAHLYTGSCWLPFWIVPVLVYNWTLGSSTSWMQGMCCFCSCQICWIAVLFSRGMPMVSFPLSDEKVSINSLMRRVVSSTPCVRHLQCNASSFLVICMEMSSCRVLQMPLALSWDFLAAYNLWRSSASHSNTQGDNLDMKVG